MPNNSLVIQKRLEINFDSLGKKSKDVQKVLFGIGTLITSDAKLNLVQQGAVDTGFLLNAIRFRTTVSDKGGQVVVGTFGVPYAKRVEFGGKWTEDDRKAMFANLKAQGKNPDQYQPKGVVVNGYYRERPYLRPAVESNRVEILRLISTLVKEK